ncbi:hypothetical protein CC2G_002948 [Coprinopsis cinerea AmutBmut pab1-1]|nr:hypothetical protein CC2G_002948 [Coprinopsis cinerea AmutBmut pab1-1]
MYQALGSLADSVANLVAAVSGYQPALAQASEALAQSAAASTQVSEALAQRADKPKTKPDPPETYDGKPEDAQAFLDACVLYFKHIGEADELRQISYALSKIKGGTNGMHLHGQILNGLRSSLTPSLTMTGRASPRPSSPTSRSRTPEQKRS